MKKIGKLILAAIALVMVNPLRGNSEEKNYLIANAEKNNSAVQIFRYYGNDRFETSTILSNLLSIKGSEHIFLVNGENFADALFSGPLASVSNSPILLTKKGELPKVVENKIAEMKVKRVTIVGGLSSVSVDIENKVKKMGIVVDRISGSDRFETAKKLSDARASVLGSKSSEKIAYASGTNFADALSATPFIYYDDVANILPQNNKPIVEYIPYKNESNKGNTLYIFGGINSVPQNVNSEYVTTRFSGADRYATSVEIAKECEKKLNNKINTVFIASGEDFPDALSVGPIVARHGSVVLLTEKNTLNAEVAGFISERQIDRINIIGGESTISKNVVNEILELHKIQKW